MTKEQLNLEELELVAGGSFAFNRNNGKVAIGDMEEAHVWQITADYDTVIKAFNEVMDAEGSDAEKNAKLVALIKANNWGTMIL